MLGTSRRTAAPPDAAEGEHRPVRRPAGLDLCFPVVVVCAVALLSALRVSGSSVPVFSASGAPDRDAVLVGKTRPIRSDEWLAWTPLKTGRVRAGFPATQVYGMERIDVSGSWRPQVPNRNLGAALYAPWNLPLVVLPLEQGFALMWWLPFAACALGVYAWLRAMRLDAGIALCTALLATSAPAAVWWSGWMCQVIAAAAIPCAILVAATRLWHRARGWAVAVAVGGALAAANLPWFYQPWALPCGVFVGAVTACWGLGAADRRRAFVPVAVIAGAVFALEEALYLLHERSYYRALQDTVYPGDRRADGGGVSLGRLLSSLFPFTLSSGKGEALEQTNLSEISMGWTILLPVAATSAALGRRVVRRDRDVVLIVGTIGIAAILTSWCFVRWPDVLARVSGLTYVPPERLAPLVGFFWLVVFALLFGTAPRRVALVAELGRTGAAIVVVVTLFVAAWGATEFRAQFLPGLSDARLWLPVVVVGVLVVLLFTRWWVVALVAATTLGVISGAVVNPLSVGLGSLDDSRAARIVRRIDDRLVKPGRGAWAADTIFADGLLNAQGVDSLSSFNDPVSTDGWRVLDPRGRYEDAWNRFAYISFAWEPGLPAPVVEAPIADQLTVRTDPCDRRLSRLRLRAVVSRQPLDAGCLAEVARFSWQGDRYTIYERSRPSR